MAKDLLFPPGPGADPDYVVYEEDGLKRSLPRLAS